MGNGHRQEKSEKYQRLKLDPIALADLQSSPHNGITFILNLVT
jgi:hypothetical protein